MNIQAYLPGVGDTLIRKGVLPWRGLSIALSIPLMNSDVNPTKVVLGSLGMYGHYHNVI